MIFAGAADANCDCRGIGALRENSYDICRRSGALQTELRLRFYLPRVGMKVMNPSHCRQPSLSRATWTWRRANLSFAKSPDLDMLRIDGRCNRQESGAAKLGLGQTLLRMKYEIADMKQGTHR